MLNFIVSITNFPREKKRLNPSWIQKKEEKKVYFYIAETALY